MPERPVHRAYIGYLYVVAFVSMLVLLLAGVGALYGVVRIAVPEQTGSPSASIAPYGPFVPPDYPWAEKEDERRRGTRELLEGALGAGLAALVLRQHWRRAQQIRAVFDDAGPVAEDVGQPEPPA